VPIFPVLYLAPLVECPTGLADMSPCKFGNLRIFMELSWT
jgi:hypothetical protein